MDALDKEHQGIIAAAGEMFKVDPTVTRAGEAGRRKKIAAIGRARTMAQGRARAALESFLDRLANF